MTEPSLRHVACHDTSGGHRMAYWQWGDPQAAHVVLCVHGLTRQGRDFDVLAGSLLQQARHPIRVICPDVVGRGRSDWLADPTGYQLPVYAADMVSLLQQLHAEAPIATLDHVGTSMGGLIGIALAGQPGLPLPRPVHRLVLNDIGPTLEAAALQRIGSYVGQGGRYATVEAGAAALWALSSGFGPHSPEQWLALSRPMLVPASTRSADGSAKVPGPEVEAEAFAATGPFVLHYDPAIAQAFRQSDAESNARGEAVLWQLYEAIEAQTLLVRGGDSDLLSGESAHAMGQRGPRARLVEFEGVGHAPTFVAPEQSAAVTSFLLD